MNEQEWLNSTDPQAMLSFLREGDTASRRKLPPLGLCVRAAGLALLNDARSRDGVEVRERYEGGAATETMLSAAGTNAGLARNEVRAPFRFEPHVDERAAEVGPAWAAASASLAAYGNPRVASEFAARAIACTGPGVWQNTYDAERAAQAALLHDIFGPFLLRPLFIEPPVLGWNDGAAVKTAKVIYEERAFDRMPLLARIPTVGN